MKERIRESINRHFPGVAEIKALRNFTTWKIGGDAVIVSPTLTEEIPLLLKFLAENKLPWTVLGSGSNVLASDKGTNEVVIHLPEKVDGTIWEEAEAGWRVRVPAGIQLPSLAQDACRRGAEGLVFAVGIPGTLGGAVFMNAGAYGTSMADIVSRVWTVLPDGESVILDNADCAFSYRSSRFQTEKAIITSVELKLNSAPAEELKASSLEILNTRSKNFPLDLPNAGSVFKRPEENIPPGRLIEECGLKGTSIGGAEVSRKHANFIVNNGNATASDVYELIGIVKNKVLKETKIRLKEEVRYLGNVSK